MLPFLKPLRWTHTASCWSVSTVMHVQVEWYLTKAHSIQGGEPLSQILGGSSPPGSLDYCWFLRQCLSIKKAQECLELISLRECHLPASALPSQQNYETTAVMGGCFCKKDFLMSYTVVVVSFGFLSMFGVLIPTGIATLRAIQWVFNQFNVLLLMLDL